MYETTKRFGVSKNTMHTDVAKGNGFAIIDGKITLNTIMEKIIKDSQMEEYGILDDGLALYFKNNTEMTKMLHIIIENEKNAKQDVWCG